LTMQMQPRGTTVSFLFQIVIQRQQILGGLEKVEANLTVCEVAVLER